MTHFQIPCSQDRTNRIRKGKDTTDDLASGFLRVDRASDFAVFSSCLTLIDSLQFFAECKRESYDLLDAVAGHRMPEVLTAFNRSCSRICKGEALAASALAYDSAPAVRDCTN